jgi:dihydrodipicolinate synthase/N-acetylneuraminate lyase
MSQTSGFIRRDGHPLPERQGRRGGPGSWSFHVTHGTDGLIPCGTTGESPTLNHDEHHRVVEIVIEGSARPHPGSPAPSNSTAEAIDMTKHASGPARRARCREPPLQQPTQEGSSPLPCDHE